MFSKIKAVLIDLSGTIHIDSNEIPGSIEALKRLKQSGLKYKFVTNTTKESQSFLYARLNQIGFDIKKEEIFTSLLAANDYILHEKLKPLLLLEDVAFEDFKDTVEELKTNYNGEAVVVGLSPSKFNYENLNEAFQRLLSGARLIAIHQGRYYKTQSGLSLGPGPFVKALAYAADIDSESIITVGKPERKFFLSALQSLDSTLTPQDAIMIGDDVRDDIHGAQCLGMKGILVQSGKYRINDENKINPGPTLTVSSFSVAVNMILDEQMKK